MKKYILKKWFWIPLILAFFIISGAFAVDFASIIEQKIALERSFEDRLRGLLEKILGTDRFIVIVNVEPETETTEVARETWVEEKKPGGVTKREKRYVLPGVPVREKLGEEKAPGAETLAPGGEMKREYEKVVVLPKSFVRRVVVTIILDEKIEDALIEMVRGVAAEILGLDTARGDLLIIKKQHFSEPSRSAWSTIKGRPIYWLLLLAVFFLFLLFPIRIFLRGLARIFPAIRPREAAVAPATQVLTPAPTFGPPPVRGEEKSLEKKEEKPSHPFSFINQSNLRHLLYLLKDESAETISVIVSYLNPTDAIQVMASLPRELKTTVTEKLAKVREVPPEVVNAMEDDVKGKIDYIVGGTEQLVEIVDEADKATREEILESLRQKQPELAEQIRKKIFTFEDIARLDTMSFQAVLRELDLGTVSLALRGAPDWLKSKVMSKLSEGAQAILRQEMELGKPAGKQRIEEAQRRIVRVIRGLQREDRVTFEPVGEAPEGGPKAIVVEKEMGEFATPTMGVPEEGRSASPATPAGMEKVKSRAVWVAVAVVIVMLLGGFWWYQRSAAKKRLAGTPSVRPPIEGIKGK